MMLEAFDDVLFVTDVPLEEAEEVIVYDMNGKQIDETLSKEKYKYANRK